MRFSKLLTAIIFAVASPCLALAQSNPGLTKGQVLTAGQWNALFAGKQDVLNFTPMNVNGGTFLGRVVTAPPGASTSGFNLTPGTAPGSPANGDLWVTSLGIFARVNGATVNLSGAAGISVGTTVIASGTNKGLLYDNAGVLGNLATGSSGLLVTDASGVPSITQSLFVTNPTANVPFPTFDATLPNYTVGFGVTSTWTGNMSLACCAIAAQVSIETTATNVVETQGLYGGAAIKKSGIPGAYGVTGVVYNYSTATVPSGSGLFGIVRGELSTVAGASVTGVTGVRSVSEVVDGQHPNAGYFVYNSTATNAFNVGYYCPSAANDCFRVGYGSGSGPNTIMPAYAFSLYNTSDARIYSVAGATGDIATTGTVNADNGIVSHGSNKGFSSTDGTVNAFFGTSTGFLTNSAAIGTITNHPVVFLQNNGLAASISSSKLWNWAAYTQGALVAGTTGDITSAALTNGQIIVGQTGAVPLAKTMSADATLAASGALTLATVNSNVGTFGSATQVAQITANAKGLVTAVSNVTIAPALGSITGLGTGVATALAVNIGTAGAPVVNGGALGSPSSVGTLPAHTLGGAVSGGGNQINNVVIGASTPLAGTFTTLTANAGATNTILTGTSTVSNTSIAAYYNGPVLFYKTLDSTNNNTLAIDFRGNVSSNSYAAIVAQITDQTGGAVKGKLALGVANGGGAATNFVYVQPSGGLAIGTDTDPSAGMIYTNSASFMIRTKTSYASGAAATSPTLGAAGPSGATTPTKWIPVDDNGTTRYIPAW